MHVYMRVCVLSAYTEYNVQKGQKKTSDFLEL